MKSEALIISLLLHIAKELDAIRRDTRDRSLTDELERIERICFGWTPEKTAPPAGEGENG